MACPLAAQKLQIPIAYLEAGLRSGDWGMPEKQNRVLTGHVASIHFCSTEFQAMQLAEENIHQGVHVVGNAVVDASLKYAKEATESSTVLSRLHLEGVLFVFLTLHRAANVDDLFTSAGS
nr:UDP-N-acetylglucosamine 2-epimerase [Pajaroellobacter abortibovis]